MDRNEEYRRLAAHAYRLSQDARDDKDRLAWLRLAQSWLNLIGKPSTEEIAFDKALKTKGTGQNSSDSWH